LLESTPFFWPNWKKAFLKGLYIAGTAIPIPSRCRVARHSDERRSGFPTNPPPDHDCHTAFYVIRNVYEVFPVLLVRLAKDPWILARNGVVNGTFVTKDSLGES
jgi:hypothetical protein